MIKELTQTGRPLAMVLINGGMLAIAEEKASVPAIVETFYPGFHGGTSHPLLLSLSLSLTSDLLSFFFLCSVPFSFFSFLGSVISEVLFGDYNPGGKLPVTIYDKVWTRPSL